MQNKEKSFRIKGIYAFYDKKADRFDVPFFAHDDLSAKRHFYIVSEGNDVIKNFLTDFDLYRIGIYDHDGTMEMEKKLIQEGLDLNAIKKGNE